MLLHAINSAKLYRFTYRSSAERSQGPGGWLAARRDPGLKLLAGPQLAAFAGRMLGELPRKDQRELATSC
jgi:hypothetical protein